MRAHPQHIGPAFLQRYLRIGYNRAATLLEQLEAGGVLTAMDQRGRRRLRK